jgi:hypothetical protein
LSSAVKAGQVGIATDTGHAGSMVDSTWAAGHPERVRDYGWRAIHVSTVAAKEIQQRITAALQYTPTSCAAPAAGAKD